MEVYWLPLYFDRYYGKIEARRATSTGWLLVCSITMRKHLLPEHAPVHNVLW